MIASVQQPEGNSDFHDHIRQYVALETEKDNWVVAMMNILKDQYGNPLAGLL